MGRIEYWLLGAVGALIAFVAFESFTRAQPPDRYALQIEQAGRPRGVNAGSSADSTSIQDELRTSATVDVNSIVLRSRAPAPVRNVAEIRKRISDGAERTYIVDMLQTQDSTLFR